MDSYTQIPKLIILCFQLWTLVAGGSCWWNLKFKNVANGSSLLSTNVTRSECCMLAPAGEKFYSDDDEPFSEMEKLMWRYTRPHRCVTACHDGCASFSKRCGESEICKVKSNGIPKCLCNPLCSQNSLSHKGAICGSDDKTYSHHCQLLRSNCRKQRTTGVSYYGKCKAYSCENIKCAREGDGCITDQFNRPKCIPSPALCSSNNPVCATDGKTYRSLCHMTQHNINHGLSVRVSYYGQCTDSGSCSKDTECKKCLYDEKTRNHVCITTPMPLCDQTSSFPQVCATDGKTYSSECLLRQHSYIVGQHITVLHVAACNATNEKILATGRMIGNPGAESSVDDVLISMLSQQKHKSTKKNKKRRDTKKRRAMKHFA